MKTKKIIKIISLIIILFTSLMNIVNADETDVNLTIRSGNTIIFSNTIPLPPAGTIELNSHSLDADSVLSVLNSADILSSDFSVSDLQYYDSFGSFYLKCITSSAGNNCDNWQYVVNNIYGTAIDKTILHGGENVYLYFGPHYRITLDSNSITNIQNLKVIAQNYDYQNNDWIAGNGLTIGIIEPSSWPTVEIQTSIARADGTANFSSIPTGSYNVGIQPDYFPTESLTVINAPIMGGAAIVPVNNIPIEKAKFDQKKAFEFLVSQQKENGSFGEDLYTDWIALSLANTTLFENQKNKLIQYLLKNPTLNYQLTDYERHSMALMALGLNPYDVNGENYIKKITDAFDGKQFGNIEQDNDDIFALIVLQNAGYGKDEDIIKNTINFILSSQKENGSWDESVDMTGAAIEALSPFSPTPSVRESLEKAKNFLKQNQKDTGGWDNVSSTSWAVGGILSLLERPEDWVKNNNTPLDYFAKNQDNDGGTKNEYLKSKIWETAYILTALSGKNWNQIMQKFEKPKEEIIIEQINKKSEVKITPKKYSKDSKVQSIKNKKEISNDLTKENTANIIEATKNTNVKETEIKKSNWLKRLFARIFGY